MQNKRQNDAVDGNTAKKQKLSRKKPLRFANILRCKREKTKKYIKDVQNGSETKLAVNWDKEEYLSSCNPSNNKDSSYQIVKNDNGEYEQILTRDGDLTGKSNDLS